MELPAGTTELSAALGIEVAAFEEGLGGRSIDTLFDLPEMSDPERVALLEVLYQVLPSAVQSNAQLWALCVAKAVNLALGHGNSPLSSYFYLCYGGQVAARGDFATAHRLGQLGMRLDERFANHAIDGANQFVFGCFILPWSRPLSESLDYLRRGLQMSLDAGDPLRPGACACVHAIYHLFVGDGLDVLSAELDTFTEILERTGDLSNLMALKLIGQLVANLQGRTSSRRSLDGPGFDAAAFEPRMLATRNTYHVASYHLFRAIARYHAGDYQGAREDLEQPAAGWAPGCFANAERRFYHALSLAGRARAAQGEDRRALVAALREDEETLRRWAEAGPENLAHRHALAAAELAAIEGDNDRAQGLFDRAAALAREGRSVAHEALASELCARFHLGLGRPKIARVYLADACAAYQRWGATVKVEEIAAQLPAEQVRAVAGEVSVEHLDALTVIKASQAISTEIVLSRLIKSLMRIAIEHAGAERGYLLLVRDGELWVEGAAGTGVEPERFERLRLDFGAESARALLPQSILGYVQRTGETALLNHTDAQSMFEHDPYLATHPWRSLLCLPMVRQGSLVGLLYLENSLAGGAFSPDRVGLLEVLSSQAAISLENAALYEEMEQRVEDRTRKLEASTGDLEQSLRLLEENQAQRIEAERKTAVAHYEREMAIARQIQTSILPQRLEVPGLEIAAGMVTASEVGGDYYDLLLTDDGGCWLGIGDVSGHGLDAGLVMLMIQSGLATLMRSSPHADPARLVGLLNEMLYENIRVRLGREDFATLSLFRFHPDGRFVVAGAHEDMLIWRARSEQCEEMATVGTWVGVLKRAERHMKNQENRLDPGDLMVLYTDGITEAKSPAGEQFELTRLAEVLAAAHAEPAEVICRRILERVAAWSSEQADDQTLVVVRRRAA
jgi:serine phosphatase RsbU (regulator of sigma subunit)